MKKKTSRTCIAIIKTQRGKIIMAGDRRVSTTHGTGYTSPVPKIMQKNNGILIGASGSSGVCHQLITGFEPPELYEDEDSNEYMLFKYLPNLRSFFQKEFHWQNKEKTFHIPTGVFCSALIVTLKDAYQIDIIGSEGADDTGMIDIDRVPTPFVIGCGAISAYPILQTESKLIGYNTKAQLEMAMKAASEISDGCDNYIDYLTQ